MSEFRRGRRIGIDVGTARVGVAVCDPDGMLATPVETVTRNAETATRIAEIVREYAPIEVLIGLPISLKGNATASTADARDFAREVARVTGLPVRLVDERLSTVTAHQALRQSGRTQRQSRNIVDQVAAVVLLQSAIDTEKRSGVPGGQVLDDAGGEEAV